MLARPARTRPSSHQPVNIELSTARYASARINLAGHGAQAVIQVPTNGGCTVVPAVLGAARASRVGGDAAAGRGRLLADEHAVVRHEIRRRRVDGALPPYPVRTVDVAATIAAVRAGDQPVLAVPGVRPASAGQGVACRIVRVAVARPCG